MSLNVRYEQRNKLFSAQERIKNGIDSPDTEAHDTDKAIRVAVEAIKLLIERDKKGR